MVAREHRTHALRLLRREIMCLHRDGAADRGVHDAAPWHLIGTSKTGMQNTETNFTVIEHFIHKHCPKMSDLGYYAPVRKSDSSVIERGVPTGGSAVSGRLGANPGSRRAFRG